MNITVFTKDACVQCDRAKKFISSRGEIFVEKNIYVDPVADFLIKEHGFVSAPIVALINEETGEVEMAHSGFSAEKIVEQINTKKRLTSKELAFAGAPSVGDDVWDF